MTSTSACSLQEVLAHAGERARDLVANLGNFAARERVQYEELDSYGMLRSTQTATYDYAASIEQRPNQLVLSETRRASSRDKQLGGVAQDGGISLGLIFHPYYQADYDLRCEGMDRWKGVAAWVIDFKQRKDRPGRTRSFNTAQGAYHLRLKGRAWIAADSYQILHIETNLADPVLLLRSDAVSVDYAPVDFRSHNLQIWLPRTTQSYSDFMERRQIVLHTFSDFLLSSVETNQTIESPH